MSTPVHDVFDYVTRFVFYASVLNLLLPPWDIFADYPGFQKKYRLFVTIVSRYGALNMRTQMATLYKNGGNGDASKVDSITPSS